MNDVGFVSIVVGIDGSAAGERALSFAIGLAKRERARISACFVSHPIGVSTGLGVVPMDYETYAKELEQGVIEQLERADVGGEFYHREGDVVLELKRLAEERWADLIVVGRSRHPHLHVGSVPRRLLDLSEQALLIIP